MLQVVCLLKDTEEQTTDEKTGEVLDKAGAHHNDTPGGDNESDPLRRFLESDKDGVGRDLKENVRDEEEHVGDIVVGTRHAQVKLKALDLRISKIGAIQKRQSLPNSEKG